jgi:hypothetical protein
VDCFAWFNNITTLGSPPSGYRHDFDGTSGASAIIAGAVVSLQGILKNRGRIYNSSQMRAWISNPLLGTPSNDMINDLVGVMPDLEKLIDDLDHPSVDIYVRDNIDDNGSRYAGMISASPDVITKPFAVMNPDTAFGAGSGTENTRDLGNSILAGLDNYIYVRVKNKGLTPMNNVQVQVYYSEVGTLITPDRWNLIGNTTIPVVPAGDILTVTPNPIVWPAAEIPASGHYCYVCLIGCTEDPMPDPILLSLADWDDFNNMIRDNNNITWRNFNVINLVPASYHMPLPVPFNMHGAQNKKVKFGFQLAHTFPYGTRIQLEFPADLLPEMSKTGHPIFKNEDANYITWDHGNVIVLENMELPESYKGRCRIMINFPENELELNMPHFLTITQLYKNKIAGKITWEIKPPETA